jgi:hypothetical protein
MAMKQDEAVEMLCSVYQENQHLGLVLGAGVSKDLSMNFRFAIPLLYDF